MTKEELAYFGSMDYLRSIQDESGVDVTQIDRLLAMTPTQRLAHLQEVMASMKFWDSVRVKNNGGRSSASGPTASGKR